MLDMILHEMESLTLAEKRSLIGATKAAVARQLAEEGPGSPDRCPRCGSSSFVRKGHGRRGEQRWACKGCGRTFSTRTRGLLSLSKLPADTWASYVECMLSGKSLRESAGICHVCLKTSWFMRIRLCEVMSEALAPFRSGPSVSWQVDGTYLDESLKGNRSRSRRPMPRRAHPNGHAVHARGISNMKVCVICGANDLGDSFCRLADRGRPGDEALERSLVGLSGSAVQTDDHQGYARVLPGLGVSSHAATRASRATHGELGMVNALHQRLSGFLLPFNGVSTKWLAHYLAWFEWTEQARHSDAADYEVLSGQAAQGRYEHTRRQLTEEPQPFWDFWERRASMSTVV